MDKETLFRVRLKEDDVELDGVGTVRVRALSREEYAVVRDEFADDDNQIVDPKGFEYALIAMAMVDPADMSAEDVSLWAKAAPGGEVLKVLESINTLSGLDDLKGSKSVPANRSERRAQVRARAGKRTR